MVKTLLIFIKYTKNKDKYNIKKTNTPQIHHKNELNRPQIHHENELNKPQKYHENKTKYHEKRWKIPRKGKKTSNNNVIIRKESVNIISKSRKQQKATK